METKSIVILITVGIAIILNSSSGQTAYQNDGLASHNGYRPKHGSPFMNLDSALSMAAQDCAIYYAKKRKIDHSCVTDNAGENLFAIWGGDGNPNLQEAVQFAIKFWYDENVTYNYEDPEASTGVIGHFTQLIWKSSTALGIGAVTVNGYTAIVAKYAPPGNVILLGSGVDKWKFYKENVQRPAA